MSKSTQKNHRNPDNNSILQALNDLQDYGLDNLSIREAIALLRKDTAIAKNLQQLWNKHRYPNKALEWVQLAKDLDLMTLSPNAIKTLIFMGQFASTNGLLQISILDLCKLVRLKQTAMRKALDDLVSFGAIRVESSSRAHDAKIYEINPAILNKGARFEAKEKAFADKITRELGERNDFNYQLQFSIVESVISEKGSTHIRIKALSQEEEQRE